MLWIKDSLAFIFVNLERTVAIALFDEQVERKAQRLSRRSQQLERTHVGGVAEAVLEDIDPELLERAKDRIAEAPGQSEPQKAQVKRQERLKQRQKKCDQDMEL